MHKVKPFLKLSMAVSYNFFILFLLDNVKRNEMPSIGDLQALEEIWERRRNMTEGYGLLRHVKLSHL